MADAIKPVQWDSLEFEAVTEMVSRREISGGGHSLVQTYLRKGSLVPVHTHSGDQWITVLQGALAVTIGCDRLAMREGDVIRIPASTPHQIEAVEDTLAVDFRSGDLQLG